MNVFPGVSLYPKIMIDLINPLDEVLMTSNSSVEPYQPHTKIVIGSVVRYNDTFWMVESDKELGKFRLIPITIDKTREPIPYPQT
jgi:hypothetical protein